MNLEKKFAIYTLECIKKQYYNKRILRVLPIEDKGYCSYIIKLELTPCILRTYWQCGYYGKEEEVNKIYKYLNDALEAWKNKEK